MGYLLLTSLLWAFSFGLIKGRLVGLDPNLVALVRLAISLAIFIPWFRWGSLRPRIALGLMGIGAIQFGLMYVLYITSYGYLAAHEVALFTVLTPLYVALFSKASSRRRAFSGALLACAGAGVIQWNAESTGALWTGFALVQCANICFAVGQLMYKRIEPSIAEGKPVTHFALLYLGACLAVAPVCLAKTDWGAISITPEQVRTLLYLGALPSGLGFYLWNRGATRVSEAVLSVMNNLKVPLGVLVSLTVFGESAELLPLALGSAFLAIALWVARRPHSPV
jgi:drug/metabolite transporter (DMT)-like permease